MKAEFDLKSVLVAEMTPGPQCSGYLDVGSRRQLLFSARMRFSPETQSVRQQAGDRMIEQNLALCDDEAGLSVKEIQERRVVALPDGTTVLPREEIQGGVRRIAEAGRLIVDGSDPCKYKVSDRVRAEIWAVQEVCEQRLASLIGRLFKGATKGAAIYTKPFMDCLCLIFSRLGEA